VRKSKTANNTGNYMRCRTTPQILAYPQADKHQ